MRASASQVESVINIQQWPNMYYLASDRRTKLCYFGGIGQVLSNLRSKNSTLPDSKENKNRKTEKTGFILYSICPVLGK